MAKGRNEPDLIAAPRLGDSPNRREPSSPGPGAARPHESRRDRELLCELVQQPLDLGRRLQERIEGERTLCRDQVLEKAVARIHQGEMSAPCCSNSA